MGLTVKMNEDNRKQYINWHDPYAFVDNMLLVYMHYVVQGHKWEKKKQYRRKKDLKNKE